MKSLPTLLTLAALWATSALAQMSQPMVSENTTRISDHVWAIMGFPNIAIVVGNHATLVVDTGLHAQGWTHAQAAAYLRAQLMLDDADANLMTDRFVALPGDALACKMGELKIQALLTRARQLLGPRFDIREFHSEVLKDGAMPLDILEAKMQLWLEARR